MSAETILVKGAADLQTDSYSAPSRSSVPPHRYTPSISANQFDLFSNRPPIDLANPELRKFAAALSPAYLRVSGTWANSTFFSESDDATPSPPVGYKGVLTAYRWHNIVDFSKAINTPIVTSFVISPGTRDVAAYGSRISLGG